jgi:hypothetical protein
VPVVTVVVAIVVAVTEMVSVVRVSVVVRVIRPTHIAVVVVEPSAVAPWAPNVLTPRTVVAVVKRGIVNRARTVPLAVGGGVTVLLATEIALSIPVAIFVALLVSHLWISTVPVARIAVPVVDAFVVASVQFILRHGTGAG